MKTRTGITIAVAALPVIAIVVVALGLLNSPTRPDLARDLIGRWACTETNRVGGPLSLSEVAVVQGEHGPALKFNGSSSRVEVADSPAFAFRAGSDFSVLAWIKPQDAPNSFGVMSIVEKRKVGGITTALGFSLHLEYGALAAQISPAPGFRLTRADILSPPQWILAWKNRKSLAPVNRFISKGPNLCDGSFHQVALTVQRHSKEGGRLYVDGAVVLTFDPTKLGGSLANHEPILIGTHPDKTLQCGFKGEIADVRLYFRALSPEEVRAAENTHTTP
jgi:Concanavalin A-like lectin/glucanases superfamily